jgi:hypothetical protein
MLVVVVVLAYQVVAAPVVLGEAAPVAENLAVVVLEQTAWAVAVAVAVAGLVVLSAGLEL